MMSQYQAIVDRVIPAWAADPGEENRAPSGWSQQEAEAQLFARLRESESSPIQRKSGQSQLPPGSLAPPNVGASSEDALWRHMWVQFASALLLVAALGLMVYRTGIRRGLDLAASRVDAHFFPVGFWCASSHETSASERAPASATTGADQQLATLRIQLGERPAEIEDNCIVVAPFAARVTNLTISQGTYATAGQHIFSLIDNRTWWVVTNFQETQLHNIRPGMLADVYVMSRRVEL